MVYRNARRTTSHKKETQVTPRVASGSCMLNSINGTRLFHLQGRTGTDILRIREKQSALEEMSRKGMNDSIHSHTTQQNSYLHERCTCDILLFAANHHLSSWRVDVNKTRAGCINSHQNIALVDGNENNTHSNRYIRGGRRDQAEKIRSSSSRNIR